MPDFLYIFGFETPRQRHNNATRGWDDEDSHGVLIDAADENSAIAWGHQIAQRYFAQLHDVPEASWAELGYASFIEDDRSRYTMADWPRVAAGEFPDFSSWLKQDRA